MKKLIYPLSIIILMQLTSCDKIMGYFNDSTKKEDNTEVESEAKRLEEERKNIEKERLAAEQARLDEENREIQMLEAKFKDVTNVYVSVKKAYFHTEANEATKRKAHLIENEIVSLFSIQNGFGYVEYYNYDLDKTTSGWINLRDLEPSYDHLYN